MTNFGDIAAHTPADVILSDRSAWYGTQTTPDTTIAAGTTTLAVDSYYHNLTIQNGGILNPERERNEPAPVDPIEERLAALEAKQDATTAALVGKGVLSAKDATNININPKGLL
jgi:hypothetical protein